MSHSSPTRQPRPLLMRPGVVLFQVAFAALLLLGVVLGLRQSLLSNEDGGSAPLPDRIAQAKLVSYVQGEEAVASMSQLHINGIAMVDGYIGHYEGGATVWVGIAADEGQARQMVQAMTDGIAGGGSPFSDPQAVQMEGQTVYMVLDESQQHNFYYQKHQTVIWVQPPASDIEAFLSEALRLLHS